LPHDEEWKKDWKRPVLEHGKLTPWNWMVLYPDGFVMGNYVDIGAFTLIQAEAGVELRDEVEIGSHCGIYSHSSIDEKKGKVYIGKCTRIGSHSTIMPGVTIGEGTIIGAHSLVIKDIPSNALALGVPAKVVRWL